MLFSIVVPIYNVENYLKKCLISIQNQTFNDFECILVDDGSTDNSAKICDSFCCNDDRFKVIHKKNGGLVSSRQAGANLAKGEYIVCVDGDDWIKNNFLFNFAAVIEKYHPDILCCGCVWYYSQNNHVEHQLNLSEGFYDRNKITKDIFPFFIHSENGQYFQPSLWAKAFRREIYITEQMLVDDKIKIGEDIACTYSCVYAINTMFVIKDCLYFYRKNELSMTHKKVFDSKGPMLIGKHLEKRVENSKYDFKLQINRLVVHLLFNCCKSQFYSSSTYNEICEKLNSILNEEYYSEAIKNCRFAKLYIQGQLVLFALKYRLFFLIKIFSIVSRR